MNILLERAIEWFCQMGVTVSACPEHISVPRANLVAAFGGDPETIYGEVQELLHQEVSRKLIWDSGQHVDEENLNLIAI